MIPDVNLIESYSLSYEDLEFSEENGLIYKDLALLSYNRTSHFLEEASEDEILSVQCTIHFQLCI